MRKNKKSQAAMEFLMTYGWALLVVLIVIAALAYFGLLNPNRFLGDKAEISPGLDVDENSITLIVQDGLGRPVYDFQVNATECNSSSEALSSPVHIPDGKTKKNNNLLRRYFSSRKQIQF
jgi:hypothetical protein